MSALVAGTALLLGCATVKVRVEADPDHDFSLDESFAWMPSGPQAGGASDGRSASLEANIRGAVERELTRKGYRMAEAADAHLHVGYILSFERRYENPAPQAGWANQWGYVVSVPRPGGYDSEQGTLVIDVADPRDDGLVWRGSGSGRVLRRPRPEQAAQGLEEAVAEILADFPERP